MLKSAKSRAEEQFTATRKKPAEAVPEYERERQERTEQMARLRALRLAKEAADKQAAAEKAEAAPKARKRTRLPQADRQQG